MKNEISLLFSGGVDSTIAAMKLASSYERVHLLTYCNGYAHFHMGRSRKRFMELKERFPGKFIFYTSNIKDIFQEITVKSLLKDYKDYYSGFIWCLGCKLSMHARTIIYNLENRIKNVADGSSYDTREMVEQKPFSVSLIKVLYEKYGIRYTTPVYQISREQKRKKLKKMGFFMGIPVLDRYLGIQPRCIPGELYYLPSILFNKSPYHQDKHIYSFFRSKQPIINDYVNNYFKNKSIRVSKLVKDL